MNRFIHWLGWKVWGLANRFPHVRKMLDDKVKFSHTMGMRKGKTAALIEIADTLELRWPPAPTVDLYRSLKLYWINDPVAILFMFPICIVEDEEGLTGKLVYNPDIDLVSLRWVLAALWIKQQKAEKGNE